MGAAISDNVASQMIDTSITIANQYVQTCRGSISQQFNVDYAKGCTGSIGTITVADTLVLNTKCIQNVTTQNSMKSDIQAQLNQQAIAAAQSIGGPSLTNANVISNVTTTTAEQITNLFTQTCVSAGNQSFGIKCTDPGTSLTVGAINIQDTANAYTECTSNADTINGLKTTLSSLISQTTNASEANTLSTFVIAGLVILAFFAIFFVYSINGPIGWFIVGIVLLIIVALIVYATVAYTEKLYPFNQKTAVN